jgi:hypothetical protein
MFGNLSSEQAARALRDARLYLTMQLIAQVAPCLYGVHCGCFCSLIVKEELNIFSLGLSPNLEAEEKMWWGRGVV